MLTWLIQNLATIFLCAVLMLVVGIIIAGMIKNKKQCKSSCGCSCSGCAMSGTCHQKK